MEGLLRIEEDLFDITRRLKEIDPRYEVYRNPKLNRFEVHANGALQIAVPFERLDARTVELVRSTRLEYAENMIRDMDRQNARLKESEERRTRERIMTEVEKAL